MYIMIAYRVIALQEGGYVRGIGPDAAFEAAWVKMMNDQPLVCAKTGTTHEPPLVRPSVAILDVSIIWTSTHVYRADSGHHRCSFPVPLKPSAS